MGLLDDFLSFLYVFVCDLHALMGFGELASGGGELRLRGLAEGGEGRLDLVG